MKVTHIDNQAITIVFSTSELAFLCNAINESLEAVEEWEFQTRMGETRKGAAEMLVELRKLLHETEQN